MKRTQHAQPARQSKPFQGRQAPQRQLDLNVFKPLSPMARRTVDDLIARGSVLTMVQSTQVRVQRMGRQNATIDAWGRVEWSAALPRH